MNYICLDGKLLSAEQPVLAVDNKAYRYGDGLFETMKVWRGQVLLGEDHFRRFFSGLQTLEFEWPPHLDAARLLLQVQQLCERNQCGKLARVRLTAFRGNGGIYDGDTRLHYTIESWPLTAAVNQLNENGLHLGLYPLARKSCDVFAAIKSANYLPYVMAARYARQQQLNDCLVLNAHERVADATIANVFLIKNGVISTPALTEGCVAGVMRAYLLRNMDVKETLITPAELLDADEVFLTNAISGIRWVGEYGNKKYANTQTVKIYREWIKTFFD